MPLRSGPSKEEAFQMFKLPNSRRSLLQAVFTQSLGERDPATKTRMPWVKRAFLAATRPTAKEIAAVSALLEKQGGFAKPALNQLEATVQLATSATPASTNTVEPFGELDDTLLLAFAERLDEHRQAKAEAARKAFRKVAGRETAAASASTQVGASSPRTAARKGARTLGAWFALANASAQEADEILEPLQALSGDSAHAMAPESYEGALANLTGGTTAAQWALKQCLKVEPVGYLLLERVDFTPAGVERGELVGSVPLAPGEEVHVSRREWTTSSEDFVKTTQEIQESVNEENVSDKAELLMATTAQTSQSMGFNTGVTATGGYGPVTVTATAGFSLAASQSQTDTFSRAQTMETTRKAASRSRRDQKVSFRVVSASGQETTTAQQIKNPFADKPTRVDYYRLVRKWLVEVYRYGVRLTYDITIPEPGIDLLRKHKRLVRLEALLLEGLETAGDFNLTPSDLTRENYALKAAAVGAYVPPPPPQYKYVEEVVQKFWKTEDEAKRREYHLLEVEVDEDYVIADVPEVTKNKTVWNNHAGEAVFRNLSVNSMKGKTGRFSVVIATQYLGTMYFRIRIQAKLRDDLFGDWQLKAWNAIREAAVQKYEERRQGYKEEIRNIREALGKEDALSLRRVEREEVMKGVLRWIFGPDFRFVADGTPTNLYTPEGATAAAAYQKVLAQGDLIRFLHQAIEWENMLFFLYPYFWSSLDRWDLKKDIQHPDPLHRSFLKAGAARVVLTIRPGFERDFLKWMEQGDKPMETHPYMTIIQEMEAYAKTNFPGIPAANEEGVSEEEPGYRVGGWFEYTPTSALDIAFGETLPTG